MIILTIGTSVLSIVLLGVVVVLWRYEGHNPQVVSDDAPAWLPRMEALEGRFDLLRGEVYENLEQARNAHRKAAQAKAYLRRREESGEGEDEPEEIGQLPLFDGNGGEPEGMQGMSPDLAGLPPHLQYAKIAARRMIGGGNG